MSETETTSILVMHSKYWLEMRDRANRASGLDASLNLDRDNAMEHINYLLDGYFMELKLPVTEEFVVIPTEDGRGSE